MSCNNKTKYTCGDPNYATCIEYQKELPEFTKIEDECYTIEETTEDQYILLGEIKDEIDLSELGESCLEYLLDENDKIVVKNVLLKYEEKICDLEERLTAFESTGICDLPISGCDLDFSDLVDECGEQPTTLKGILQLILDTLNTP
jgi:hypothetical protein